MRLQFFHNILKVHWRYFIVLFFRVLETDFYNPDSSVAVQGSSTLTHTDEKQTVTQGAGINTLEQRSSQAYLRGPGPTPHKFRGGGYHDDYRTRPRHQYRTPNFNQDTWVFFSNFSWEGGRGGDVLLKKGLKKAQDRSWTFFVFLVNHVGAHGS